MAQDLQYFKTHQSELNSSTDSILKTGQRRIEIGECLVGIEH